MAPKMYSTATYEPNEDDNLSSAYRYPNQYNVNSINRFNMIPQLAINNNWNYPISISLSTNIPTVSPVLINNMQKYQIFSNNVINPTFVYKYNNNIPFTSTLKYNTITEVAINRNQNILSLIGTYNYTNNNQYDPIYTSFNNYGQNIIYGPIYKKPFNILMFKFSINNF